MLIPSSTNTTSGLTSGPTRSSSPGGSSDSEDMFTSDFLDLSVAAVRLGISGLGKGPDTSGRFEDWEANLGQVGGGGRHHCNGDNDPDHPQSLVQPTRFRSIVKPTANTSPSSHAASAARRRQGSTAHNVPQSSSNDVQSSSFDAHSSSFDVHPSSFDAHPLSSDAQPSFSDDPFEYSVLASSVPPSTRNLVFSLVSTATHDPSPAITPTPVEASESSGLQNTRKVPAPFEASGLSYDVGPQNTQSALQLPTILNITSHHPSSPSPPALFEASEFHYNVRPQNT
jgi:hypothetical protein